MKQLSDCCKAEIKLTGSPEHKDAFACAKCGRIIGTPIKKQTADGKLNPLRFKSDTLYPKREL